jgi:hypothetical protein
MSNAKVRYRRRARARKATAHDPLIIAYSAHMGCRVFVRQSVYDTRPSRRWFTE